MFSIPGGFSSASMTNEKVAIVGLEATGDFRDVSDEEGIHTFHMIF